MYIITVFFLVHYSVAFCSFFLSSYVNSLGIPSKVLAIYGNRRGSPESSMTSIQIQRFLVQQMCTLLLPNMLFFLLYAKNIFSVMSLCVEERARSGSGSSGRSKKARTANPFGGPHPGTASSSGSPEIETSSSWNINNGNGDGNGGSPSTISRPAHVLHQLDAPPSYETCFPQHRPLHELSEELQPICCRLCKRRK